MAAKEAVEEVAATAEQVLEAVDAVDAVVIAKKYGFAALACAWVGGVGAGMLVTHFVTKKRLEAEYDARVAREVQESIEFLKTQDVDLEQVQTVVDLPEDQDEVVLPVEIQEVVETYDTAVIKEDPEPDPEPAEVEGERIVETKPDPADLVKKNQATPYHKVFKDDAEKEAEAEVAEAARVDEPDFEDVNPDISVISRDLFMTNVSEYPQDTLTYFSDDAVLDLQGDFVADHELLIGTGKPPFGLQSEDENIVYLRNKKTEKEFEVIYDSGEAGEFLRHSLGEMYGRDRSR